MVLKNVKYNLVSLFAIFRGFCVCAQFGHPVMQEDFGLGNSDPNTIGAPLPEGKTGLTYSTDLCPPAGAYTITRRINIQGCFNDEWISLGSDYNSDYNPDMSFGNMMVVNHPVSGSRIVYVDTVNKNLCAGTRYRFSAAIINIDRPSNCSDPAFPNLNLSVETVTGQVLQFISTGYIGYASTFMGYKFGVFGFEFTMPPALNSLVLKIEVNHFPQNNCGDDFAIDDIKLAAAGPVSQIAFDGAPATTVVTSICFQDNKSISMSGSLGAGYLNPAYQWQQSSDGGNIWTDIPGATNTAYTSSFSISDTFLFRMSAAEAANISNPNCRIVSNVIRVEVDGIPANYDVISNSPVCAGQNLEFEASEGFAAYRWSGPNGFSDPSPFAHISNSSLADSGMYYVQMFTPGGCSITDSTFVNMIGTDLKTGADTAICKGTRTKLSAEVTGVVTYSWTPSNSLSDGTVANPVATPDATTTYTVKVIDGFGCINTASMTVTLLNSIAVKAAIEGSAYVCRPYDSASFKDISQGNIVSRVWDFRNGQSSVLADPPVQIYLVADNIVNYTISLSVMDTAGCADTVYHFLKVADNCYIAVPSAFTPDNDGLNDYLYPLNAYKATHLVFRVYNRYGSLVFETRDWTRKWDGTVRGTQQASGVYVWMLEYNDASNRKVFLKGTTVLIR